MNRKLSTLAPLAVLASLGLGRPRSIAEAKPMNPSPGPEFAPLPPPRERGRSAPPPGKRWRFRSRPYFRMVPNTVLDKERVLRAADRRAARASLKARNVEKSNANRHPFHN